MQPRLTDADLIQLVQEKLPEELSLAEIRLLHERLKESSELKAVLIGQLHLETYLTAALAEINVSVDEIVRRANAMEQPKSASRWPLWTGLAGVLLALGLGIYFATRPTPDPTQIAENTEPEENPKPERNSSAEKNQNNDADQNAQIVKPPENGNANPPVGPENNPPENVAQNVPEPEPRGKPTDPWFEALDPEKPPLSLEETSFRGSRWQRGEMLHKTEAQAWLKAASGKSFGINDKEANNDRWVELGGVGKLQAPFAPGTVLRLSLFDMENFKLHFWAGEEGVTLSHYRHRRPLVWAAYKSTRKPNDSQPSELLALQTTDDGRQARVRSGVLEFRYQDGSLLMSQGTALLLLVPLPSCPKDVILDGKCQLSEVKMYRGEPFPISKPYPRPLALVSTSPAEAAWMTSLPSRDLREGPREIAQARNANEDWEEQLAEGIEVSAKSGNVRLAVEKSEKPTYTGTILKRPGFYEVIFRVAEASPGTGVFFGDAEGREIHRIGFMKEKRTGRLVFDSAQHFYTTSETERDPQNEPVPYFEPGHWIRVVWGLNAFKVWTSADGTNWGMALYPSRGLPGPFASLGLMVQRTDVPKHIALAHLEIRELSAITSLASQPAR